jgi:Domain of unknown function (DUF4381)
MSDDPASLANLRDIFVPPLPSFWPPAAGVTIVVACLLAILAINIARFVQRARRNAYRRAAAAEIDRICQSSVDADAETVAAISAVLKRAALVAYPREAVASLTGAGWGSFIEETNETSRGVGELKEWFGRVSNPGLILSPGDLSKVAEQARSWVRQHQPFTGDA